MKSILDFMKDEDVHFYAIWVSFLAGYAGLTIAIVAGLIAISK